MSLHPFRQRGASSLARDETNSKKQKQKRNNKLKATPRYVNKSTPLTQKRRRGETNRGAYHIIDKIDREIHKYNNILYYMWKLLLAKIKGMGHWKIP